MLNPGRNCYIFANATFFNNGISFSKTSGILTRFPGLIWILPGLQNGSGKVPESSQVLFPNFLSRNTYIVVLGHVVPKTVPYATEVSSQTLGIQFKRTVIDEFFIFLQFSYGNTSEKVTYDSKLPPPVITGLQWSARKGNL